ncbi:hypothetical protein NEOLEDRAFT_1178955 [Neolentinus lepideus HHB14362 ss-1]|uniref:DUF6534 domain-containing protein n=1 Tax=Neolentinus lepideus HHB14362 ss-1 TaxID=1314782 RepID=A0A165SAE7_9AGAM|nr:hypothetical protein NEOLEDRAFT_1178955 [Neolentinus lepideus HHB14362 ss-1]
MVKGWGDPKTLLHLVWSLSVSPVVNGFIAGGVQIFFSTRMSVFSKSRPLPVLTSLSPPEIAITAFVMSLITSIKLFRMPDLSHLSEVTVVASVWLAGNAFCDLLIAVSMVVLLRKANKRSNFKDTNSLLYRLMRLSIESGSTTALASILHLIIFLSVHNNGHFSLMYMTAKLYSNTLIANLNARHRIRTNNNGDRQGEGSSGTRHNLSRVGRRTTTVPAVLITTTQQVDFDRDASRSDLHKIDENKIL